MMLPPITLRFSSGLPHTRFGMKQHYVQKEEVKKLNHTGAYHHEGSLKMMECTMQGDVTVEEGSLELWRTNVEGNVTASESFEGLVFNVTGDVTTQGKIYSLKGTSQKLSTSDEARDNFSSIGGTLTGKSNYLPVRECTLNNVTLKVAPNANSHGEDVIHQMIIKSNVTPPEQVAGVPQRIVLEKGAEITGKVIFEGGAGVIEVCPGASFTGTVEGGTVCQVETATPQPPAVKS